MNSLNFLERNGPYKILVPKKAKLTPCISRCRGCHLFPFEQLENANINKGEDFGIFIIHGEHRKTSSHGVRLICALTRHRNEILPKDYLIQYVWPESTIVSNNLNVAIYDLRILLKGASIDIANHRKEGYSLTL